MSKTQREAGAVRRGRRPQTLRHGRITAAAGIAVGVLVAFGSPLQAQTYSWNVTSGDWNTAGNWLVGGLPATVPPTTANQCNFGKSATVSIAAGTTGYASTITVTDKRTIDVNLGAGAQIVSPEELVFGHAAGKYGNATFNGPATGAATVTVKRIRLPYDSIPTSSLTFSGSNLVVVASNTTSDVNYSNSWTVTDGATVTCKDIYCRNGAGGRLRIEEGGSLTCTLIDMGLATHAGEGGLVQLAGQGTLALGPNPAAYNLQLRNEARFEAEGSGLDAGFVGYIRADCTVAVGVQPVSGTRSAPQSLNLNSTMEMLAGSYLEMGIFGSHQADQIDFGASSDFDTSAGAGAKLKLVFYDYTPKGGDSWTLFTGTTANITGALDLSLLDADFYDLSKFNEAGGWIISVPPKGTLIQIR